VSLLVWNLTLDLSGLGDPVSSYVTAGIALEVIGASEPHRHDKAETPPGAGPCKWAVRCTGAPFGVSRLLSLFLLCSLYFLLTNPNKNLELQIILF
jgi:hypothetical protein